MSDTSILPSRTQWLALLLAAAGMVIAVVQHGCG